MTISRETSSKRADGRGHWPAGVPRHAPADHWPRTIASLGKLLARHSTRRGPISAAALGRAIGVSDTTVRRWVAGRFAPTAELQDAVLAWIKARKAELHK